MKKIIIILLASIFLFSTAFGMGGKKHKHSNVIGYNCVMDNISIDMDDGTIILEHRDYNEPVVEITAEYELYINGELIETDDQQKKLVKEFYVTMDELIERAKEIGNAGAKIGIEGAKLGIGAIGSIFKLLDSDYDTDDLEREIEAEAEELEAQADLLEEEAEDLEDMADDLEEIYEEMEEEIVELGELDWK